MPASNARDLIQPDSDDSRREGLGRATAIVIRAENNWIGLGMEYDDGFARHGPIDVGWTLESRRVRSLERFVPHSVAARCDSHYRILRLD